MRKTIKLFSVMIAVLLLSACAVTSNEMSVIGTGKAVPKPAPGKALVIFMRPSLFGGDVQSTIYDGNSYIGTVSAKTRVGYQAKPGYHLFMVVAENADFMQAFLKAGKTYYVIVEPHIGMWKARFVFNPQNGQMSPDQIKQYLAETKAVKVNSIGRAWYAQHKKDVMNKKAEYWSEWQRDNPKKTLYSRSGV